MAIRGVHRGVLASKRIMLSKAMRIDSRLVLATVQAPNLNDTNAVVRHAGKSFRLCANMK
jgi:hypothetical protein